MRSYYYVRIIFYKDGSRKVFFVSGAADKFYTRGPFAKAVFNLRVPKFVWEYLYEIYMKAERREFAKGVRKYKDGEV